MTRIQCVHEPDPPWNRTRGSPLPQTRHTIVPSPQGVLSFRAVRAMASTSAAGSTDGPDPLGVNFGVNWCMCGWGRLETRWVAHPCTNRALRQPRVSHGRDFALLEPAQDWLEVDGIEQGKNAMAAPQEGTPTNKLRIAVIPGDGIGNEVVPEGMRVLEAVGARFGIDYAWDHYDWSCQRYAKSGAMMPADGLQQIAKHDAVFLGAVGWPGVADHVSLWGLLIPIRRGFQQYVNLRPVRLFDGLESPLKNWRPGQIDLVIVRENNEGEYSTI